MKHYERALPLIEQKRWQWALDELLQHLAEEANDSRAMAMAALCQLRLERFTEATETARLAIASDPDNDYAYYILSHIFRERNHPAEARDIIDQALRLAPEHPDYLSTLAQLHLDDRNWTDALANAEEALEFEPLHLGALNARATALIRLGRGEEAAGVLEEALAKHPEDPNTLTNMGWLELERSQREKALGRFKEALLNEPEHELARQGLMEAMRARYPFYGFILKYSLWMSKHSDRVQSQLLAVSYVVSNLLAYLRDRYKNLAYILVPLMVIWRFFVYLTWTARAASNLMLRISRYTRCLVNREEVLESNLVGSLWGMALFAWAYLEIWDPFALTAKIGIYVFLSLPMLVGACFAGNEGWPRTTTVAITSVMAVAGLGGLICLAFGLPVFYPMLVFYFEAFGPLLVITNLLTSVNAKRS